MFKFLILGMILSQAVVKNCYGQTSLTYESPPVIIMQPINPPENDSSDALILQKAGPYHIYASRLNLYFGGSGKYPNGGASNVARKLDADYVVTEGIGAHKLHVRKLSWGKARRICVEEGGHLAVIRSDLEEKILREMMADKSISLAWVGYHDIFEEGDWFTVLEEPIAEQAGLDGQHNFQLILFLKAGIAANLKRTAGWLIKVVKKNDHSSAKYQSISDLKNALRGFTLFCDLLRIS